MTGSGLAVDDGVPTGTYEAHVAAQTARRGHRPPAARPQQALAAASVVGVNTGVNVIGGAKGFVWVAPDNTNMVGVVISVGTGSGNIEIGVYDEHMTKLGGSGQIACPASSTDNYPVSFPTGVPVVEGYPYVLLLWVDNATASFKGNTYYCMGDASLLWRFQGAGMVSGLPTQINPKNFDGVGGFVATQSSGQNTVPTMVPLLEPVNVKKVASDLTVQNATAVIGADSTNNRLFATSNGGSHLLVSTDRGVTTTDVGTWTGETIRTVKAAGAFVVMGSQTVADNTGKIRRANRTGPFDTGSWTDITPGGGQEGYCLPWNLSVSDDGIIFAGNYTAPTTNVRLRRSPDWGVTWTIPIDLGASRTVADGVLVSGSTSYTSKTLNPTSNDIGSLISGTNIPASTKIASLPSTTIVAPSGGVGLPAATINVGSTTGFAATGTILVPGDAGVQTVTYTGVTSTTFTGCTGGTGHMTLAGTVTQVVMSAAASGAASNLSTTVAAAEHIHSVRRSTIDPTKVYANIGDSSPKAGWYVSADTGATWTRKSDPGTLRVTQLAELPDGKIVGGSDDFGTGGGNLFIYDPIADTLRPFSNMTAPWYGDVYGLRYDSARDWIWYLCRGNGANTSRRAGLFVSPDRGQTSYLVADLGTSINPGLDIEVLGNYVFNGDGQRFPISSISFP